MTPNATIDIGTGFMVVCGKCRGAGYVRSVRAWLFLKAVVCDECGGTGAPRFNGSCEHAIRSTTTRATEASILDDGDA